jgi:hypothetical protein
MNRIVSFLMLPSLVDCQLYCHIVVSSQWVVVITVGGRRNHRGGRRNGWLVQYLTLHKGVWKIGLPKLKSL